MLPQIEPRAPALRFAKPAGHHGYSVNVSWTNSFIILQHFRPMQIKIKQLHAPDVTTVP